MQHRLILSLVVIVSTLTTAACATAPTVVPSSTTASANASSAQPQSSGPAPLHLVAIGDSIPYNSPDDCPGCQGFVARYAEALQAKTGRAVTIDNLSQHNGLDLTGLLDELDGFADQLASADAIIVGIAHNTIEINTDHPCGATWDEATNTLSDWSKITPACSRASVAKRKPQFQSLYSQVASLRAGKPTILLTINKYNDFIGWEAGDLTKAQEARTLSFHDDWNKMLCAVAVANKFTCVDIYHAFSGPHGDRSLGDLVVGDYTHPSDKGNELIAKLLIAHGFAPLA